MAHCASASHSAGENTQFEYSNLKRPRHRLHATDKRMKIFLLHDFLLAEQKSTAEIFCLLPLDHLHISNYLRWYRVKIKKETRRRRQHCDKGEG
jgi:hypothetical protein